MNLIQEIEADANAVIAEVKKDLKFLVHEGQIIIAWVDHNVPGAQVTIANFVREAEADAAVLAKIAAQGFSDVITSHMDTIETAAANLVSRIGLPTNASSVITAVDAAGIATLKAILQGVASVALANVLGKLGQAQAPK